MKPSERSNYREQQLVELYDYYFKNNLASKDVTKEVRADVELRAAYIYLNQKGLVNYDEQYAANSITRAGVKINAHGIDVAEQDKRIN